MKAAVTAALQCTGFYHWTAVVLHFWSPSGRFIYSLLSTFCFETKRLKTGANRSFCFWISHYYILNSHCWKLPEEFFRDMARKNSIQVLGCTRSFTNEACGQVCEGWGKRESAIHRNIPSPYSSSWPENFLLQPEKKNSWRQVRQQHPTLPVTQWKRYCPC